MYRLHIDFWRCHDKITHRFFMSNEQGVAVWSNLHGWYWSECIVASRIVFAHVCQPVGLGSNNKWLNCCSNEIPLANVITNIMLKSPDKYIKPAKWWLRIVINAVNRTCRNQLTNGMYCTWTIWHAHNCFFFFWFLLFCYVPYRSHNPCLVIFVWSIGINVPK